MANRTTSQWLTTCLYYGEPWEEFLVKAVKPYVDVVLQTGVAESFFFQRSWDQGPNIRLWFKGNPFYIKDMLKPNIKEHFLQYFESRPSFISPPNYPADFPEQYKWRPNNSVYFMSDGRGIDRFNGRREMPFFENQFQATSMLVLDTIRKKSDKWSYNEILLSAVKFHLGLTYSVGMSLEEAAEFFELLFQQWISRQMKHSGMEQQKKEQEKSLIRSFSRVFSLQQHDTVPYHAAIWELLKNYRKLDDQGFIHWLHVNSNTNLELSLALENGTLPSRPNRLPEREYKSADEQNLWHYYEEFIRLTNNRLGIASKDEGYLFYVLAKSLDIVLNRFSEMSHIRA